jgi:hypothetical protein
MGVADATRVGDGNRPYAGGELPGGIPDFHAEREASRLREELAVG